MRIMEILEKNIINIVSEVCNVPEDKIIRNRTATRHANVVIARQVLVNLLYRNFNYTNHNLRDILGYKNHASIVHARGMHDIDYKTNIMYRNFYNKSMDHLGLYVNSEDIEASRNIDMKKKIEEQDRAIGRYKDLWINERAEKERIHGLLINFKKKYMLK
tara:strand:+ start:108 stop:587 length:480 start_codon:yes stop_codon:yes gene_type:complete